MANELARAITPFTVLGLLREIEGSNGFGDEAKRDLRAAIAVVESHFFAQAQEGEAPDLRRLAEDWVGRAS